MNQLNKKIAAFMIAAAMATGPTLLSATEIGSEAAVPRHLQDGKEFTISLHTLIYHGKNCLPQTGLYRTEAVVPLPREPALH